MGGAREELIAELHRTVGEVASAVDAAAERTLAELEADARHHAEAAAAAVEAAAADRVKRLRELGDELGERVRSLIEEIDAAGASISESARGFRSALGLDARGETASPGTRANNSSPPSLDDVEAARDEIERSRSPLLGRFRRADQPGEEPVPEGVRVIVNQMRMAGESQSEILRRLEEMGVENPADALAALDR